MVHVFSLGKWGAGLREATCGAGALVLAGVFRTASQLQGREGR